MTRSLVVACKSALAVAAALAVFAPVLAGAQTSAQAGCITTLNKSGAKVASTQGKANAACVKGVALGKIAGTADACMVADAKGKLAKAEQKTIDSETAKCLAPLPPYGYTSAATINTAAVENEIDLAQAIFGSTVDDALDVAGAGACQAAVAKAFEKLAATRGKEFVSCKSGGFKTASITDADGLTACISTDAKGKVAKARSKIQATIDKKCAAVNWVAAFPGCKTEVATSAILANCIARNAECQMCEMIRTMDGLDSPCDLIDDGVVNGTCSQCGNGKVDPGEQCDDAGQSANCDDDCTYPICGDGNLNTAAGELCDDGNNVAGDGCQPNCDYCGDGVVQAPEECDDGNLVDGDGCDPHCKIQGAACPTKGELTLLAGTGQTCATNGDCVAGSTCDPGLGRCVTATQLDTGWTGISHGGDVVDQVVVTGDLLCPSSGPTCGQCDVLGVVPERGSCRCKNDSRAICDKPFKGDLDNCGGDLCQCYFGPPLPLSAGNTPACVVNRYREDISGTANVDTGAGLIDTKLASIVYLGESTIQPCPVCGGTCTAPAGKVGSLCGQNLDCDSAAGAGDGVCGNYDPVVGDGIRGGKCFGGDNNGQSCDIDALSTSFPAPQGGGSSLDCIPSAGKNVSGTGLKLTLQQTTGVSALPPAALTCNFGAGLCPCGQCSNDAAVGCTSNADCGAGTCATVAGERPNQCDDGVCSDAGGGKGVCNANLPDRFCDGIVRPNGEGFLGCTGNDDCLPINIGVAGGSCTLSKQRECFLDPITVTGVQNADTPLGVATFCIAQTSNSGINTVAGLPGPARSKTQAKSRLFCANNQANLYTPGVGCP